MGTDGHGEANTIFFRNFENVPKKQPLCGKRLGKTSTKLYKIRCRIELDTGPRITECAVEFNSTMDQ